LADSRPSRDLCKGPLSASKDSPVVAVQIYGRKE
jgi:hypothetical protein